MITYDDYQDSGVIWLGLIPSSWSLKRMKQIFWERNDRNISGNTSYLSVLKDKGVVPYSEKGNQGNKTSDTPENYKMVCVDDIVMNPMNVQIGSVGISKFNGCLSSVYVVLVGVDIVPKFYDYLFQIKSFQKYLRRISYGILEIRESVNKIEFFVERLPYPPLPEQHQIVSFLDEKTSLIDDLITKKEQKIGLLKEYRTSLINRVITKGLNPDCPMKDSGVEWIGMIPSHWDVKPLKRVVSENQSSLGSNTPDDYELDYVEISDLDSSGRISNTTHYLFSDSPSRCRRVLSKGDVFISCVRTYLRAIGIVEDNVENLICSTGFSVLTPNDSIVSKYLFYSLRTEWFISDVVSQSEGVSYPSIQSEKLLSIRIVKPPLTEQEQIVSFLDEKTGEIDRTIQSEQNKIELLKEYRQSLISSVITGKIKVVN